MMITDDPNKLDDAIADLDRPILNWIWFIIAPLIGVLIWLLLSMFTPAGAQAPACTVWYSAGVVTCDRPPALTATATQKPKRERSSDKQGGDAGYPAPGDPEPSATVTSGAAMPYPPPISGDPYETQPPIPTPDFAATYQADLCMHAGLCTATPTSTPRPTPTLAPDCSIPPNASVWRCENGTGVPVSEATVTYTPAP